MQASISSSADSLSARARAWVVQLRLLTRRPVDFLCGGLTYFLVLTVMAIVAGVRWILVSNSLPTIQTFGLKFLTNDAFDPVHNPFGVGPAIFGTFITSAFAMIFAVPIGVGMATFRFASSARHFPGPLSFLVDSFPAFPSY